MSRNFNMEVIFEHLVEFVEVQLLGVCSLEYVVKKHHLNCITSTKLPLYNSSSVTKRSMLMLAPLATSLSRSLSPPKLNPKSPKKLEKGSIPPSIIPEKWECTYKHLSFRCYLQNKTTATTHIECNDVTYWGKVSNTSELLIWSVFGGKKKLSLKKYKEKKSCLKTLLH